MGIDLSNVNLEVVDLNINATPDIYINRTGVTFTKRILEELNYPQNVQYCIDSPKRIFAIRVCKSNEQKAIPFSKNRTEQTKSISTNNKVLKSILTSLLDNYNSTLRYTVTGTLDLENRTMYFDMHSANISDFRSDTSDD